MDNPWRDAVRDRLLDLNINQGDLARWVGTVQSQISHMLSDRARRSNYVERVSAALQLPLPDPARIEIAVAKLLETKDTARLARLVAQAERYVTGDGDSGNDNGSGGSGGQNE